MEEGCLRELRHDFRAVYHVAYDDVPAGEAIDLILTLPAGSMYAAAKNPCMAWSDDRRAVADLRDLVRACLLRLSGDRSTLRFPLSARPEDEARAKEERERVSNAQRRINETRWEAV